MSLQPDLYRNRVSRNITLIVFAAVLFIHTTHAMTCTADERDSYNVVVMDSLSLPLSCACVPGVGQRRYEPLCEFVSARVGQDVNLIYEESLQLAQRRGLATIDVVIGKRSLVLADAEATGRNLNAVCELTDRNGKTTLGGVLLVSKTSGIKSLAELQGQSIAIGSEEHFECHAAVRSLLNDRGVKAELLPKDSIEEAVYAFDDGHAKAVAVSDYLPPLLEGCGKLAKGSTRVIARTAESPAVQVFLSDSLSRSERDRLMAAFLACSTDPQIINALESKNGFQPIASIEGWTDWRGPRRDGKYSGLPRVFDDSPEVLWRATVTGPAMAGLSATPDRVFVADKTSDFKQDIFRAFDAENGKPIWQVTIDAPHKMDYTNAPRATPVVAGERVLLQSAFGQLICVDAADGSQIWSKHLVDDFGGELPTWGYCVPPLVVDQRVIVSPGGP
ncbi:MAG: PhnD/SsuA/transferrin family substrate-binding protein, partial [Planctomycetota bacterium]